MVDPNEQAAAALRHAGEMGGLYVESLDRTDLSQWSASEWATLVEVVVTAFQDHLQEAYALNPPF